jgi:hypothetical protein
LILGIETLGFSLGATLGSLVTGYIFDVRGTYFPAFLIAIGMSLAAIILTAWLKSAARAK